MPCMCASWHTSQVRGAASYLTPHSRLTNRTSCLTHALLIVHHASRLITRTLRLTYALLILITYILRLTHAALRLTHSLLLTPYAVLLPYPCPLLPPSPRSLPGRVGLSQLADTFVSEPGRHFSEGQSVRAAVTQLDTGRQRFALSLRLSQAASSSAEYIHSLMRWGGLGGGAGRV